MKLRLLFALSLLHAVAYPQSYTIDTIAGITVIKDSIPATQAFMRSPLAVVTDAQGVIYIADNIDNRVRRIGKDGVIVTIAGTGAAGFSGDSGPATQANLSDPSSLAVDQGGATLYICDRGNFVVRKVDLKLGTIATVAGNGKPLPSGNGGDALKAGMSPDSITIDNAGNLYISDYFHHQIRKVDAVAGIISAFAGTGSRGYGGDNGLATSAAISYPYSITTDGANALYIADWGNSLIRRVDLHSNIITLFAGTGYPIAYGDAGPPLQAGLEGPEGVSADADGNLLILDNNQLRYIAANSNLINTIAGSGALGSSGEQGSAASSAQFAFPGGITIVGVSNYLVADTGNYRIRRILNGNIFTVGGLFALDGQKPASTILNKPSMATYDSTGELLVADSSNNRIRKVGSSTGTFSTILGTGVAGWLNNRISGPRGVTVDPNDIVYVADTNAHRVLRIDNTGVSTIAGVAGQPGYNGDNRVAKGATLDSPLCVRLDLLGNLYIVDAGNSRIRKIDTNGVITTVAGNGILGYTGDNVAATTATMDPRDLAIDAAGNLFIADGLNGRIRRVAVSSGLITTVAGVGAVLPNNGDGGPANRASFLYPTGIAIDSSSNLFVADYLENTIRRIDGRTGIITRVAGAGVGQYQFNGDSGAALLTNIGPKSITMLADGSMLVADPDNDRIRKLTPQVAKVFSIKSGDKQTAPPGTHVLLTVVMLDGNQVPVSNAPVNFALASGDATIDITSTTTGADGTAFTQVTLGATSGPVTVRASSPGFATLVFSLTSALPAPPPVPVITSISGLPQSHPPVAALSKNGLLVILGQNLAAAESSIAAGDGDLVSGKLPQTFQGICVDVSGVRAPLLSVSANQIIFQAPDVPVGTPANLTVLAGCGTALETPSAPASVPVQATSPEFFYTQVNADGTAQVSAINWATGLPVTTVQPGDQIAVYLTGLGTTDPAFNPGDVVAGDAGLPISVSLQLGSQTFLSDYAGLAPAKPDALGLRQLKENAGVYEILMTVPADAPAGNLMLQALTPDSASPVSARLTIGSGNGSGSSASKNIRERAVRQVRK